MCFEKNVIHSRWLPWKLNYKQKNIFLLKLVAMVFLNLAVDHQNNRLSV